MSAPGRAGVHLYICCFKLAKRYFVGSDFDKPWLESALPCDQENS
ncbi:hypothetical protein DSUL_140093 [Desulfovibrionales bacterium]